MHRSLGPPKKDKEARLTPFLFSVTNIKLVSDSDCFPPEFIFNLPPTCNYFSVLAMSGSSNSSPTSSSSSSRNGSFDQSLLDEYRVWTEIAPPPESGNARDGVHNVVRSVFAMRRELGATIKKANCLTHETDLAKEEKTILELVTSSILLPNGVASHYKATEQCFVCVEFTRGSYVDYLTAQVGLGSSFKVFTTDITTNLIDKHLVSNAERELLRFSLVEFRNVLYGTHRRPLIIWIAATL